MLNLKNTLKLKKHLNIVLSQLKGQHSYYRNSEYYTTGIEFDILKELKEKISNMNNAIEDLEKEMNNNRRI
ncbi:hypothetical protein [Clostridium sporogenes]|uniref:hypothetical protein n=1 Tax=Clostridium sporogenes TaxID=1509 RepID=UPI0013D36AB6|nr:hypothetical protein [Clostridium sporogenes]NFF75962.1 hypothetical protein [Clostridium sporogenes]NFH40859.1 hypothetical protein [Clostridium sporogenes]